MATEVMALVTRKPEEEGDAKDLLKEKWMDEELNAACTATSRTRFQGQQALWHTHVCMPVTLIHSRPPQLFYTHFL
jgi:hypothetical protein